MKMRFKLGAPIAQADGTVVQQAVPILDQDDESLNPKFLSTKFVLAFMFGAVGCVALFIGKMQAVDFNWLVGIVLSGHGASNIIDKKLNS